jgi:endonuclease I
MKDPCGIKATLQTKQWREKQKELQNARNKMVIACQNGGKRSAWKRFGRKVCALERELYGKSETAKWFEK